MRKIGKRLFKSKRYFKRGLSLTNMEKGGRSLSRRAKELGLRLLKPNLKSNLITWAIKWSKTQFRCQTV
jgi:hypothetical protein